MISYYFMSGLGWLISKASDKRLESISWFLAMVLYRVFKFRRRLLLANIPRYLGKPIPPKEADDVAIKSLQSLILTALETIESKHRNIAAQVALINQEEVKAALKEGKGCYIICSHTGNWEALAAATCQNHAPSYVPVKPVGTAGMNRFVTELRKNYGLHTAMRKKKGDSFAIIKEMLANNHIVGFMHDQSRPGSPKLNFFGYPAKTNVSMAAIWAKLDAPMIPAVSRRLGPRRHEVQFYPRLPLRRTDDLEKDVIENSVIMNASVETLIRSNVSQHLLIHDRWKE